MPKPPPIFLPAIRRDIQDAVQWSEVRFGIAAANRYAVLIAQALRDVRDDPQRPGARFRPDLAPAAYVYHLQHSRDHAPGKSVGTPRHFVLYRYAGAAVELGRLLHDSRDLRRHLPADYETGV